MIAEETKVIIYRKSRHFDEEPYIVSVESARASISAWRKNVDQAIEKLLSGGMVTTRNHNFYGKFI